MPEKHWTREEMEARVVRYADLRPCTTAFIDAKTPGSHLKENFTIIGPGVAENPDQYVHIQEPHGFNVGAARQPSRIINSPHSHETAEVFMVYTGDWRFYWGVDGKDGEIVLHPGDVISLPTGVFRGFENVGEDTGFLLAVLGKDDPGRVSWAPQVIESAQSYGLVLLKDGRLIDTTKGIPIPEDAEVANPMTAEEVARFRRLTPEQMSQYVIRFEEVEQHKLADAGLLPAEIGSVYELAGARKNPQPGGVAEYPWPFNFVLNAVKVRPGGASTLHRYQTPEVFMPIKGSWRFSWGDNGRDGELILEPGDTFTFPPGIYRRFEQVSQEEGFMYLVLGGDQPQTPEIKTSAVLEAVS